MKKSVLLCFILCLLFSGNVYAEPVRMAYLQSDIHQLPFWVAIEKGLFEKEGVPVSVAGIFKAGPELMSGFSAGVLDMGYVGAAPAITAVANRAADVVILAQVNTEGSALVVATGSTMRSPGELAGRTTAIPGYSTVQDALFRKALSGRNVAAERQKTIVLKPPEMIGALRTGQIDAFVAWEPFPAKAVSMGVGRILTSSRDIWKDHPCCVLVANREFLTKNRAQARKVVLAHIRAVAFIKDHPREAIAIAVKYTGMDEATVRMAMGNVKYTNILNVAGINEYTEFLKNLRYIKINDVPSFTKKLIAPDFDR
jgi:NitT/TauT family transport system substrate-binding protein